MPNVTDEGKALIKRFEGCRLSAYRDAVGILTIGYGHVLFPWQNGDLTITQDEADQYFDGDCMISEYRVNKFITCPLNDNQFSAIVSLVFNVGISPLEHTLGHYLNAGNIAGAVAEFDRWVYANGKKLPGLIERRAAEKMLFLKE